MTQEVELQLCSESGVPMCTFLVSQGVEKGAAAAVRKWERQRGVSDTPSGLQTALSFIGYALSLSDQSLGGSVLAAMVKAVDTTFLSGEEQSIHAVLASEGLIGSERDIALQRYFAARDRAVAGVSSQSKIPALFEAARDGSAGLAAVFGGQGPQYIDELRTIFDTYPFVKGFIRGCADVLLEQSCDSEAQAVNMHWEGFDIMQWIEEPELAPPVGYLSRAPVSYPLIGLTQLANFFVFQHIARGNMPFGEFVSMFRGATGHSQGIVSAIALALSSSEEEFVVNTHRALRVLFWCGLRAQEVFPELAVHPDVVESAKASGEGTPSPMMVVRNLPLDILEKHVKKVNGAASAAGGGRTVEVSLLNMRLSFVVSGHPESLRQLQRSLQSERPKDENQSRVPYSKRKHTFSLTYLNATVPFHSVHLDGCIDILLNDLARVGDLCDTWTAASLGKMVVSSTHTGANLAGSSDLLRDLVMMQLVEHVHWRKCVKAVTTELGVSHVLDFGPGGRSSAGAMIARNCEGTGVTVVLASSFESPPLAHNMTAGLSTKGPVARSVCWEEAYAPRLVRVGSDGNGKLCLDTKMTRLIGKAPIMVAGMTPTTVSSDFVASIQNAGYHAELAAGGLPRPNIFEGAIERLVERMNSGEGVNINLLFLNSKLWSFQFPMIIKMRQRGVPIESVTVAAGIPTPEKASEMLSELAAAGIRYVCFKPGSSDAINQVIDIARLNPTLTIGLQWTGGRAGGHHSFEDMHQPILDTYGAIRDCENIVLIAGSGLGDGDHSLPYLTGQWSTKFGYPAMPFDGILLASRVMVAAEAPTSNAVKKLLAATPGIENEAEWETSYDGDAGGVLTVNSELGEPIHKVANRGMRLWREFDKKYFSLPAAKQTAAIINDRDYIIQRLNEDYQKVYFGRDSRGRVVDVDQMTYEEVALRMVELMTVRKDKTFRWIHQSYRDRLFDFLCRVEGRFVRNTTGSASLGLKMPAARQVSFFQSASQLDIDPESLIHQFCAVFSECRSAIMSTDDVDFFVQRMRGPGKPVNFIPVIDKDFKVWFKKDSLWYSEDLDAVVDGDPQRVCILQGPVAVRYSTTANEPVSDILDSVRDGLINGLVNEVYRGKVADTPCLEYIGGAPAAPASTDILSGTITTTTEGSATVTTYAFPAPSSAQPVVLPDDDAWLATIAGSEPSWLRALLSSAFVVRGKARVSNPMLRLCRPRADLSIRMESCKDSGRPRRLVFGPAAGVPVDCSPDMTIEFDSGSRVITTKIFYHLPVTKILGCGSHPLELRYLFDPSKGYAPIHEIEEGRVERVLDFYKNIWLFDKTVKTPAWTTRDVHRGRFHMTREKILEFSRAIGTSAEAYSDTRRINLHAPMDMTIVACWEPLMKCLFASDLQGDLLNLVHLSNAYVATESFCSLQEDDTLDTEVQVIEVMYDKEMEGKKVAIECRISKDGALWCTVTSRFLIRGRGERVERGFRKTSRRYALSLNNKTLAILQSKPWVQLDAQSVDVMFVKQIIFAVDVEYQYDAAGRVVNTAAYGDVLLDDGERVGEVEYNADDVNVNIVEDFLGRHARLENAAMYFKDGGYNMLTEAHESEAPLNNSVYGRASLDLNPIHMNPFFADLAGLPGTITHGMWTSANGRRVVETFIAKNQPDRVMAYDGQFLGMVTPGETLFTQLKHVGMRAGRMVVDVTTVDTKGMPVFRATAEVEQPRTAFVYTGQGSAEVGMGMELYKSSKAARDVWDRAEGHLYTKYGFSILEIVRKNPQRKIVYFGGPRGAQLRENYRALEHVHVVTHPNGEKEEVSQQLFPDITDNTPSYTFYHKEGLLFSTQFTQLSICTMEYALTADMKAHGLFPSSNYYFAGHSLGEYGAVTSLGNIFQMERLLDVVFHRGMTMLSAVERDAEGLSNFAMVAANPSRISSKFTEEHLNRIVNAIASITEPEGGLIQVVNYNVAMRQYVVAGDLVSLDALGTTCSSVKVNPSAMDRLELLANECVMKSRSKSQQNRITLTRGVATIPLPGIDVPFHSKQLRNGVTAFRYSLRKNVVKHNLNLELLEGRYVPNVTARLFEVSQEYVRLSAECTSSPILEEILLKWDDYKDDPIEVAYSLIVELLAYQFASPVRWIETQDLFFQSGVERVLEIGPAPTLANMAKQTVDVRPQYQVAGARITQAYYRDRDAIYYECQDMGPEASSFAEQRPVRIMKAMSRHDLREMDSPPMSPVPRQKEAPPSPPRSVVSAASAPSVPAPAPAAMPAPIAAASADDGGSLSPLETLTTLIALKLKTAPTSVAPDTTLKELVGGKSAMQNEILGDLESEFGGNPENAAEMPLSQFAAAVASKYSQPGKVLSAQIGRMIGTKMPGGMGLSHVKNYLKETYGMGDGRVDGVLVHALSMAPANRLSSEADAKSFLDTTVDGYGGKVGRPFRKAGGAAQATAAPAAATHVPAMESAAAPVPDAPPSAVDSIVAIVTLKSKAAAAVSVDKSIKDVVGGKSALQNEIVADVIAECGNVDNMAEMPLDQLGASFATSYKALGKQTQGLINKLTGKLPGGMGLSQVRAHLSNERLLGPGRSDAVLVHALLNEPSERLGGESEAIAWINSVVDSYGQKNGLSIPTKSASGGSGAGPVVAAGGTPVNTTRFNMLFRDQVRAYLEFLDENPRSYYHESQTQSALRQAAEAQLDMWTKELGDIFGDGIRPRFDSMQTRVFNSYWNLAAQDLLDLYYRTSRVLVYLRDQWCTDIRRRIVNRSTPELVSLCRHYALRSESEASSNVQRASYGLLRDLEKRLDSPATYMEFGQPTMPSVSILEDGSISYKEVPRDNVATFEAYVSEMREGLKDGEDGVEDKEKERETAALQKEEKREKDRHPKVRRRTGLPDSGARRVSRHNKSRKPNKKSRDTPVLFIKKVGDERPAGSGMAGPGAGGAGPGGNDGYDVTRTSRYLDVLAQMAEEGVSFEGKSALITGCGRGSIGIEVVKRLLAGGARVVATTSSFSRKTAQFFQEVYQDHAGKNAELIVVPFNQASSQDVTTLMQYVYAKDGLDLDLDYLLPFAALSENGRDVSNIDSRSELAHRVMLTNVMRLIGALKSSKEEQGISTRPTQVLLPLSPNHGIFGNDGLYAESKLALESLMNKWTSEDLAHYISFVGAVIGWTRGTGLMNDNNLVAPGIEAMGVRTFSPSEMAFNLVGLMHPTMVTLSQQQPVWAELSGGMQYVPDLKGVTERLRLEINSNAELKRAVHRDHQLDRIAAGHDEAPERPVEQRANIHAQFPPLPTRKRLAELSHLEGMIDPAKVAVVTGFGEVSTHGNARLRWEIEAFGEFSIEGCIMLAWMVGLIKYHNGPLKDGKDYTGWVDTETSEAVADADVKKRYEETMLKHCGIRIIEPEIFQGYDPKRKTMLHTVAMDRDTTPFEISGREEGETLGQIHGDKVEVFEERGVWYAQLKKGAVMHVPKALRSDRLVAGQIPSGWDPVRLGVPKDIVEQVDPVTLYTLCSVAESMISMGVTDPYEFYEYVHVSEVGNTIGGGMGGSVSTREMYRERVFDEKPVQGDILQETFINTSAAWVNMLLLSSSGPIKTPVGACATAAESVEIGVDTVLSGKASIVIVGGVDDFTEESSNEFQSMKATSSSKDEFSKGREPAEMSRPTTDSRAGFMEAHGAGTQFIMTGEMALKMGVPIYGVIALSNTATDKEGRSVPAPGRGVLTAAREAPGRSNRLLDLDYRRKQLEKERAHVACWRAEQIEELGGKDGISDEDRTFVEAEAKRMEDAAVSRLGNFFYCNNPSIAPIRGALSVYGLTVDDIYLAYFHGTGTKANDDNESGVIDAQMEHLGRSEGNALHVVCQKWLTGHPKGAAAAWMLNGVLQCMMTGLIPGNRNGDNVDGKLRKYKHLVYPTRTLDRGHIPAATLTSFGFGQAGAQIIVVHPDYFFASLPPATFDQYIAHRQRRQQRSSKYLQEVLAGRRNYLSVKTSPPYTPAEEQAVYLDPTARASYDPVAKTWRHGSGTSVSIPDPSASSEELLSPGEGPGVGRFAHRMPISAQNKLEVTMRETAEGVRGTHDRGIGVDVEPLSTFEGQDKSVFIERNFTALELEYCRSATQHSDVVARLAGRWCAKEATIKALSNCAPDSRPLWTGGAAPLRDIEVLPSEGGSPKVHLHGHALTVSRMLGVSDIKVSISHSGSYAVAQAHAR